MKILLALLLLTGVSMAQTAPVATESWWANAVEVTIPAVVVAGEAFPIVYRATPRDGVRLKPSFKIKAEDGKIGTGRVTDEALTAAARIRQGAIDAPGDYLATFEFLNSGEQTLRASARVKVRAAPDMATFYQGQKWDLPRKNLYLSSEKAASWAAIDATRRDVLGMERVFFSPYLEQPHYDNSWYPVHAWNELHEILNPDWVPPLALVAAAENGSRYPPKAVAYAAWSQNGFNIIYQGEIGERAWFYVESPAKGAALDLRSVFQEVLFQAPMLSQNAPSPAFLARSLPTFRATTPDAPMEEVQTWIVQIRQPSALNLNFPGFQAPEKPRLPETNTP